MQDQPKRSFLGKRIGPLLSFLLAGAAIASFFVPRALDYAFGAVFLAGAARGLRAALDHSLEERSGWRWGLFHPVILIGLCSLFGGGSIAWGWLTAARAAAGVAAFAILAQAVASSRQDRDIQALGCAPLLGLFAATGWLGLFPPFLEEAIVPGTPAARTARGVVGYLVVWLAGLLLVGAGAAVAGPQRDRPTRALFVATALTLIGFGTWIAGAIYVSME
jgi:hypothetical protein